MLFIGVLNFNKIVLFHQKCDLTKLSNFLKFWVETLTFLMKFKINNFTQALLKKSYYSKHKTLVNN